ncbi:unnamed protein product (macronuclear) [Paramecium tetraurelia]|uniref:N-acetyltransferase domain-containing protein n=1 Tax=Paramecium tetraurelia TaxID=5888 RepID=A0BRJ5_PARTE|nr:uncharacterized protein GSPATT00031393001 [Paramecium tetraurelia]CAK61162.1 unnamed protein product [Paramecium tetraurelia]|eukprot:XP_001428560.1 hypothetical protein (macronuclear) [Paramecium tetraurelia strain d4-2]
MNISNINDLSQLIQGKEEQHFTFRRLEHQDVPQIQSLMSYQFLNYNPAFKIVQITEQDIQSCFTQELFDSIIQEKLSFGAFKQDVLVSACLTYDLGFNDNQQDTLALKPTERMQEIINMNDLLLGKYADNREIKLNQMAYMSHLATKSDYFHQQLALCCCFLSAQECSKLGFQQMITVAEHVATQKTFEKIFKTIVVIKEITDFKNQPIVIRSFNCSITS